MKKLLSLLLTSVLAVSMLAGCGNSADAPADDQAGGDETAKVYKVCKAERGRQN